MLAELTFFEEGRCLAVNGDIAKFWAEKFQICEDLGQPMKTEWPRNGDLIHDLWHHVKKDLLVPKESVVLTCAYKPERDQTVLTFVAETRIVKQHLVDASGGGTVTDEQFAQGLKNALELAQKLFIGYLKTELHKMQLVESACVFNPS